MCPLAGFSVRQPRHIFGKVVIRSDFVVAEIQGHDPILWVYGFFLATQKAQEEIGFS